MDCSTTGCDGGNLRAGDSRSALRILRGHSTCITHAFSACTEVACVARSNFDAANSLLKAGALAVLLDVLRRADASPELLAAAVQAVSALAAWTMQRNLWPKDVGLQITQNVCALLKAHAGHPAIVHAACSVLSMLTMPGVEDGLLDPACAADALVAALAGKSCIDVARVFTTAALAVAGYSKAVASATTFLAAGSITPLLAGIRRHQEDPEAVEAACWAINLLCIRGEGPKPLLRSTDSLKVVLSAAARHKGRRKIAFDVCTIICSVVLVPDGSAVALAVGAIDLLAASLKAFPDLQFAAAASYVFNNMFDKLGASVTAPMVKAGAVPALLAVLPTVNESDDETAIGCCKMLAELITEVPIEDAKLDTPAVTALVKFCRRHLAETAVAFQGLTVLSCCGPNSPQSIFDGGAVPLMVAVVRKFMKAGSSAIDTNLCMLALSLVGVAAGVPPRQDLFVRLGCVELACDALGVYAEDRIIVQNCCVLLKDLIPHGRAELAARMLAREGIARTLVLALQRACRHIDHDSRDDAAAAVYRC